MRKSRINDLRKSKRNGKKHTKSSRKFRGGVRNENPFLNFARKNRELVRSQNNIGNGPEDIGKVGRILGNKWSAMSQEEKDLYDIEIQKKLTVERAKEAKKQALVELKDTVEVLRVDPTPSNISFVGEDFRAAEERWNERNNSKKSKSISIGGKTKSNSRKVRK